MPLVEAEQVGIVPLLLNRTAPVAPAPVCNVLYEFLKLVRPIAEPATSPMTVSVTGCDGTNSTSSYQLNSTWDAGA